MDEDNSKFAFRELGVTGEWSRLCRGGGMSSFSLTGRVVQAPDGKRVVDLRVRHSYVCSC